MECRLEDNKTDKQPQAFAALQQLCISARWKIGKSEKSEIIYALLCYTHQRSARHATKYSRLYGNPSSKMKAEAIIKVRFRTSEEGGRKTNIQGSGFGCPVLVDGKAFDCRLVLPTTINFELGETYTIPVQFLDPDSALQALHAGKPISLWEGKIIADGEVTTILARP